MASLHQILNSPETLSELPDLLSHIKQYKAQLDAEIARDTAAYNASRESSLPTLSKETIAQVAQLKQHAANTSSSIASMTSRIQDLDQYKKNLVLSMNILKRLQMLTSAYNTLAESAPQKNYKQLAGLLSATRELLAYFKPYKSVSEINQLHLLVAATLSKLVDDVFLDFDDLVRGHGKGHVADNLVHGCELLVMVDANLKDKLLTWFYDEQLKDVNSIFHKSGEAGLLDNIGRRYLYFENNTLKTLRSRYLAFFPNEWKVDFELSKIFCKNTNEDVSELLRRSPKNASNVSTLDRLQSTLEFEKRLNDDFLTNEFSQSVSLAFEPYLQLWVTEQDKVLSRKLGELSGTQLPSEFQEPQNGDDFFTTIKINNVPNIAVSSTEVFKTLQKTLTQILRLSNGKILIELSRLFVKFLIDYHNRILHPMLPQSDTDLGSGIEPIKYLTMLLNTGDYIVNNMDDISDKFSAVIHPQFRSRLPSYEPAKDVYFRLINQSISLLLVKISNDLKLPWRRFANNNWDISERLQTSLYIQDVEHAIVQDNLRYILPMVIRDSYIRSFCDRLVEMVVTGFASNLRSAPLNSLCLETIRTDAEYLQQISLEFPKYADATNSLVNVSNLYQKYVKSQFSRFFALLKVLGVPTLPPEPFIELYFENIGDKSPANFIKVLHIKGVREPKMVEMFREQITGENDLVELNPLLGGLEEVREVREMREASPKSPNLLPKMNNFEKNLRELALNGESHVSKLNENFKSFGRFFGKHEN